MPHRRIHVTPRDLEILTALDRCPLTVAQLLKLSEIFKCPFQSQSRVRGRMQALRDGGLVRRFRYATSHHGGAPDYFKLSPEGFRTLHGELSIPPSKRFCTEIGLAHQHHTRCLADFIVHLLVSAHRADASIQDFWGENTLCLQDGDTRLYPDCAFTIHAAEGRYNFYVELDNGTERIRSKKDVDSWERKVRFYEQHQDTHPERFRILVVCTRSKERLSRILDAAATLTQNPQRSLLYGVHLSDVLAECNALQSRCFLDHRHLPVSLLSTASLRAARQAVDPATS